VLIVARVAALLHAFFLKQLAFRICILAIVVR